tara:strand:- start:3997 stop:4386 length:390 start_codon:yes stop_codon:yes gene_type:complete
MVSLPDEIVDKIKLYNSHPCADILRDFYDGQPAIMELKQVGNYPYWLGLGYGWCSGKDIIYDDYFYFYELMWACDYYDIPTRQQERREDCNCIKRGGRRVCMHDFKCHQCGVCLYWKGYEEGTDFCGNC